MSTDKNINNLILNKLTKEQYEAIEEPNPDELYFIEDDMQVVQSSGQSTTNVMSQKAVSDRLAAKVDAVAGKGLSTEDYTTAEKAKLSTVENNAQQNVQADWSETDTEEDSYIKNKPEDLVQDPDYVHTDNNYSTSEKTKLTNLADIQTIGNNLTLTNGRLDASGGQVITPVQTIGQSTTDIMSQKAVTDTIFNGSTYGNVKIGQSTTATSSATGQVVLGLSAKSGGRSGIAIGENANSVYDAGIAIGANSKASEYRAIAIGTRYYTDDATAFTEATQNGSIALGPNAHSKHMGAIALGSNTTTTAAGQIQIGPSNQYQGYNYTNYRLISGVYDGQNAHDAATKGQLDAAVAAIGTISGTTLIL